MQSFVLNIAGKPRATMKSFSKQRQSFHPFNAKEEKEKALVSTTSKNKKKKRTMVSELTTTHDTAEVK